MARARLPSIQYTTTGGLVTKLNPHLVGPNGMTRCQNADTFEEYGSLSKIPGSTRVSDKAPAGWESLHLFEHRDLSGEFYRHVVGLAGDTVYKIESDRSLSPIRQGLIAEPLTGVTAADRLYLTSPHNEPFKVDSGETTTTWGVATPSEQSTVIESFDDDSAWTPTDCVLSQATGVGYSSLSVAKTTTNEDHLHFIKTTGYTGVYLKPYMTLEVFIPEGVLSLIGYGLGLDGFPYPISIELDLGLGIFNPRHRWPLADLVEGRNLLEIDASTLSGPFFTTELQGIGIHMNTKSLNVNFEGVRFDQFLGYERGYPSLSAGVESGTIHGKVRYRISYVSKYGQESNAGRASFEHDTGVSTSPGTASVDLDAIPISPDPQVVARRIYRDQDGDAIFRFVAQIDDNTTTTYTDTDGFASLSLETCPLAGDSAKDYSRPQKMLQVISWNGFMLGIDADVRQQVNFTYKNRYEAWPITRRVLFDYSVTALIPTLLGVLIRGKDRYTILRGTQWENFEFEEVGPDQSVGTSGWRAWAPFKGIATSWHDVGPYIENGIEPWYMGNAIKDQIEALNPALFEDLIAVHDRLNFRKLYCTGTNHQTIFAWGYGREAGQISPEGSGVDPLDIRRGAWRTVKLPASVIPKCFAVIERPGDRPENWMGCDDGFVYWVGDPSARDWAVGLGSEPIDCDIEWNVAEHPQGVQIVARFLDLSIAASVPSTWEWTVSALDAPDGTVLFSATGEVEVTGSLTQQIQLPAGLHGDYMKLRLRNNRPGETGTIRRAAIQVVPRREQRDEAAA